MAPSSSLLPVRLLVLYASQTGNAIDAAERVGRDAERRGCPAVDVLSMNSFDPSCLPGDRYVVFVVSTMGQGDPPDSMKDFWKYLPQKESRSKMAGRVTLCRVWARRFKLCELQFSCKDAR